MRSRPANVSLIHRRCPGPSAAPGRETTPPPEPDPLTIRSMSETRSTRRQRDSADGCSGRPPDFSSFRRHALAWLGVASALSARGNALGARPTRKSRAGRVRACLSREAEADRPAYLPSRAASRASSRLHSRRGRHRGRARRAGPRQHSGRRVGTLRPQSPRARRHRQHRAQRALKAMNLAADRGLNTVGNRLEWRWGS
jgi:hypothetical protein